MLFEIISIATFAIVLPELSIAAPDVTRPSDAKLVYKNANHIFNAVHSSMRQWGSSLNHNGMSFFPAYLPAGTELYHGTGTPDPVEVMEWLAFEPEHALNFAWQIPDEFATNDSDYSQSTKWLLDDNLTRVLMQRTFEAGSDDFCQQFHDRMQRPFHYSGRPSTTERRPPPREPHELEPGWLHTYVMKRDLRLVYIDGQSAAKSRKGTLDSQDFVLSHGAQSPWLDRRRALYMCKIAAEEWGGRIDGFIRMEHGFELILCDFQTNADLIRAERADVTFVTDKVDGIMSRFWFLKAITARYHGIGMNRILLDYSNMVTAFAYDIDLFSNNTELPRLKNISKEDREKILADLSESVMHNNGQSSPKWTDWQAVADMIVARYSDALHEIAYSTFYNSKRRIEVETNLLTRPFIDSDRRNETLEIQRCASHFMPLNYTSSIASVAVSSISDRICSTLSAAAGLQSLDDTRRSFGELVEYLAWTSWKECRGCQYDELCMTAICMYNSRVHLSYSGTTLSSKTRSVEPIHA
ncbi:hypothetical protein MMC18_001150 [Xylographa bjoerkii]|nr:hypothetical protein [Xylographa bjoerkii]